MQEPSIPSTNIILLLTPFHVHQLDKLADDLKIDSSKNIVFYGNSLNQDDIMVSNLVKVEPVPDIWFNFWDSIKNPMNLLKHRKQIKQLKFFFKSELALDKAKRYRLILFTYHGIIPQVLVSHVKQYRLEIVEIEEGLSQYYHYLLKDHILSFLYRALTPVLIGFRMRYRGDTGRNSDSDILYVRFPKLLKRRLNGTEYRKILSSRSRKKMPRSLAKEVLIFTSPFSEYKLLSPKNEETITSKIVQIINRTDLNIKIKTHPKEQKNKYDFLGSSVQFLSSNIIGEEIDYFQYEKIIHFGSSIILDAMDSGYSESNIITIELAPFSRNLLHIFNASYRIKYDNNFEESFESAVNANAS